MTTRTPVVEGLFADTDAGVRLCGSCCASCSTPYFPKTDACRNPACDDSAVEDAEFGPTGRLWSYSVQNYPSPPPALYDEPYVPYALGVVDLDDGLRVVGRMDVDDPATLEVDGEVELVLAPLSHDDDGGELISWMFRPVR